ncbi:MAG: hypothetical protein KA383_16465 [Phycisphaerae bacterium]|nr:hypothetical protein [Phycisphaerae bacterium]
MMLVNWRVVTVVTLLAFASVASANLVTNPGFEDVNPEGKPVGWDNWGLTWSVDATHAQVTQPPIEGSRMEFIMGPFWGFPYANSGIVQTIPAGVGETFTLSAYSYATSLMPMTNGGFAVAKIEFWDATQTVIGFNEVIIGNESTVQDQWQLYTVSAVAPAGTVAVRPVFMFLQANGNDSTGAVYVDAVNFVPEPASLLLLAALAVLRRR